MENRITWRSLPNRTDAEIAAATDDTWREIHEISRDGSTTWDVMTFRPHSSMGAFAIHTERFDTEAEAQHWLEWA